MKSSRSTTKEAHRCPVFPAIRAITKETIFLQQLVEDPRSNKNPIRDNELDITSDDSDDTYHSGGLACLCTGLTHKMH